MPSEPTQPTFSRLFQSIISQVIRHIRIPCLISVVNFVLKSQFQLKKKKLKQI